MALAAYRALLRAANVAFNGDKRMLSAAKQQIRAEFVKNAALQDSAIETALTKAAGVAQILRQNVVQGTSRGNNIYSTRANYLGLSSLFALVDVIMNYWLTLWNRAPYPR